MIDEACVIVPVGPGHERLLAWQLAALARQQGVRPFTVLCADNTINGLIADDLRGLVSDVVANIEVVDCRQAVGAGQVRNQALAAATAERILMCDADDIVGDRWVGEMLQLLASVDLVGGLNCAERPGRPARASDALASHHCRPRPPLRHDGVAIAIGGNFAARREAIIDLGGWDESMLRAEDVELSFRALRSGYQLAFAPGALLHVMPERVGSNRRRPSSDFLTGVYRRRIARRYGLKWSPARTVARPLVCRLRRVLQRPRLEGDVVASRTFSCAAGELAEHLLPGRLDRRTLKRRQLVRRELLEEELSARTSSAG